MVKRALYIFVCGFASGIFAAYGLVVLAGRTGGNLGGEVFIIPLILMLIYLGYLLHEFVQTDKKQR